MGSLIEHKPDNFTLRYSDIQQYHPLDVLWNVNPEMASLAYADKQKWVSPDVLRVLPALRTAQAGEYGAFLKAMVEKHAVDADERKNQVAQSTLENICQLEQNGKITQESIRTEGLVRSENIRARSAYDAQKMLADGMIASEQIRAQGAIDALKLKEEMNLAILTQHDKGQRYLAESELKARYIEAAAYQNAIVESEKIRSASYDMRTKAELKAAIMKAEQQFFALLEEAEAQRKIKSQKYKSRIVQTYLRAQAQTMQYMLQAQMEAAKAMATIQQAEYGALSVAIKHGVRALKSTRAKKFRVRGRTSHGKLDLDLDIE